MRPFQRALATTVAGLAFAAAGIAGAAPAAATPEDGKGCVGSRSIPETFVCVISVTPENVTPTATTTNVPVTVPEVCYFLDCVAPQTVVVPVAGVTPRTGVVATLWYRGQYIPINVGTSEATALLFKSIDLATGTVNGAVGTAGQTVAYAVTLANGAAGTAYGLATSTAAAAVVTVNKTIADANATVAALRVTADNEVAKAMVAVNNAVATVNTTLNGAVATVNAELAKALAGARAAVDNAIVVANREVAKALVTAETVRATANAKVAEALVTANQAIANAYADAMAAIGYVYGVVDSLPTADELRAQVQRALQDALEPYQETFDAIRYFLSNPGEVIRQLIYESPTLQAVITFIDNADLPCVDHPCLS